MQALEGDEATVARLAEKISGTRATTPTSCVPASPSSTNDNLPTGRWASPISTRLTPAPIHRLRDFIVQPLTRESIERDPSIVNKLLLMFRN